MEPIIYQLDDLDGHEFEAVMVEVFGRLGYHVERGPQTGDEGRDLIISKSDVIAVVECKHQKGVIGRPIIQKVHSAGLTYPGATKAIVVATSTFSDGATEYARKLSLGGSFLIELWDYSRLALEARAVQVFLPKRIEATAHYFAIPMRADAALAHHVWEAYLSRLRSHPRPVTSAVVVRDIRQAIIPAIAVDYRVNKPFTTQVGTNYHAAERGRLFFPMSDTKLPPAEAEYWAGSELQLIDHVPKVKGKPVATLFGLVPRDACANARVAVSQRLSRNVRYYGRNHRSYDKWCEVAPRDVWTTARQVVLLRKRLWFQAGPHEYAMSIADDL